MDKDLWIHKFQEKDEKKFRHPLDAPFHSPPLKWWAMERSDMKN
jgi:hypothetical protein